MAKTKIPAEIKEKANQIISAHNAKAYKNNVEVEYYAIFKGDYLYLNRREGQKDAPIARLRFCGKIDNWEFDIFKWSSEKYDPDVFYFPGEQYLNGTIEGALKAGDEAYPPSHEPTLEELMEVLKQISGGINLKK